MEVLGEGLCSIPNDACSAYGLWKREGRLQKAENGGSGPLLVTVIPNCARSAGVRHAPAPAPEGPPLRPHPPSLPWAKRVWKIDAAFTGPGLLSGTRKSLIWRVPLRLPNSLVAKSIWM